MAFSNKELQQRYRKTHKMMPIKPVNREDCGCSQCKNYAWCCSLLDQLIWNVLLKVAPASSLTDPAKIERIVNEEHAALRKR